jgi:hypothetical protein
MRDGNGKMSFKIGQGADVVPVNYDGEFSDDKRCGKVTELSIGASKEVSFEGKLNAEQQMHCDDGKIQIDTAFVH